jgi:hypothetical protein
MIEAGTEKLFGKANFRRLTEESSFSKGRF